MGQYCFTRCRLSASSTVPRLSSSVTRVGGRPQPGRARGRSGGRNHTAGQYGYVLLGRHLTTLLDIDYMQNLSRHANCRALQGQKMVRHERLMPQ